LIDKLEDRLKAIELPASRLGIWKGWLMIMFFGSYIDIQGAAERQLKVF
jgi:hypothetical protein